METKARELELKRLFFSRVVCLRRPHYLKTLFFSPTPASQTDQTHKYKAEPPQQAQEVCAFVREVEVVTQSKQGTRKKIVTQRAFGVVIRRQTVRTDTWFVDVSLSIQTSRGALVM